MPDDTTEKGSSPPPAAPSAVPVVLVIDDDPAIVHSLVDVFESYGVSIATARDGAEGLATFRRIKPAVVLTDVIMPERDGIGIIMEMRRERPGLKIVAMSGGGRLGKSDFLTVAKRLGADSIVPKTFDIDQLVATVCAHLGATRLGQ